MPQFVVRFPNVVVYMKGHPKGERRVTELTVTAPDAHRAMIHAIRVVEGDVGDPVVEPAVPTPANIPVEALTTELG